MFIVVITLIIVFFVGSGANDDNDFSYQAIVNNNNSHLSHVTRVTRYTDRVQLAACEVRHRVIRPLIGRINFTTCNVLYIIYQYYSFGILLLLCYSFVKVGRVRSILFIVITHACIGIYVTMDLSDVDALGHSPALISTSASITPNGVVSNGTGDELTSSTTTGASEDMSNIIAAKRQAAAAAAATATATATAATAATSASAASAGSGTQANRDVSWFSFGWITQLVRTTKPTNTVTSTSSKSGYRPPTTFHPQDTNSVEATVTELSGARQVANVIAVAMHYGSRAFMAIQSRIMNIYTYPLLVGGCGLCTVYIWLLSYTIYEATQATPRLTSTLRVIGLGVALALAFCCGQLFHETTWLCLGIIAILFVSLCIKIAGSGETDYLKLHCL